MSIPTRTALKVSPLAIIQTPPPSILYKNTIIAETTNEKNRRLKPSFRYTKYIEQSSAKNMMEFGQFIIYAASTKELAFGTLQRF